MTIPEFSVKRRITVTMFILIITLFGMISFNSLGLDMLPDLEFPFVSIVTTYEGVGSEEIETLITKPIEQAVSTVEGIKQVNSISSEGTSAVYLEFNWDTNLDFAAQDVREKISWITDYLPEDADSPMVLKFNASSMPILEYGLTGMENTLELRKYIDNTLVPRLERLNGVASVYLFGGKEKEIQVLIDPNRIKAMNLSLDDIERAIMASNLNLSGGHVQTLNKEYLIRTTGYLNNIDELEKTIISLTKEGKPIHLGDVARVVDRFKEVRGYERTNKNPCVIIAIMKQSGENTMEVSRRAKKELENLKKGFPEDIKVSLVFDQGDFIDQAISSTGSNALMGGIIAICVIFIFLKAIRPTLAIALAIPLSVITTFIGMNLMGYTFNTMTLGGIALGVGLLVDNAVVVIESTFRHLEKGETREEAAVTGTDEVGLAITASTLTTMAVFIPMSMSQNIAGKLARPLALTVCMSLIASLFVAITIIPAIAATLFKKEKAMYAHIEGEGWVKTLQDIYTAALEKTLQHKVLLIGGVLVALVAAILVTPMLGTDFMPRQDMPFAQLKLSMPEGTVLSETNHLVNQIEDLFMARDETRTCISQVGITSGAKYESAQGGTSGVNSAQIFVRFVEKEDRDKRADTIVDEVRKHFPDLEG
ncbi:MAG: efflux RND transporter permease subunit, partial [Thermodesulfobacteriota bacterium]|nr:efflux RND transporter permease subunit [Thermodesulfobacteriota bacterium]